MYVGLVFRLNKLLLLHKCESCLSNSHNKVTKRGLISFFSFMHRERCWGVKTDKCQHTNRSVSGKLLEEPDLLLRC